MKKIFVLCLMFVFYSHSYVFADSAKPEKEFVICNSREQFLVEGGYVDKTFTEKQYLTRSDCVQIAAKWAMIPDDDWCRHSDLSLSYLYHDMPETRSDYDVFFDMHFLKDYGRCNNFIFLSYIYGDERGMRPDDLITWPEFVTLFLRVLNWDVYIYLQDESNLEHFNNSYPNAYFEIAEKLGISPTKRDGIVESKDACDFLYYIIQAPIIQGKGFATPDRMSYGPLSSMVDYIYIESLDQQEKLKAYYGISNIDETFIGKEVIISRYNNAIRVNDSVEFNLSNFPNELRAHGIIGFPELSWWFVNK